MATFKFENRQQIEPIVQPTPMVALLCPPCVRESEAHGYLTQDIIRLREVNSLVDALLLIRNAVISHFIVMVSDSEPLSHGWPDELAKIRTQTNQPFSIAIIEKGHTNQLLPSTLSWSTNQRTG